MPMQTGGVHPGGRPKEARSQRSRAEHENVEREVLQAEARERIVARSQLRLTRELVDLIREKVREGNYAEVVARAAGIHASTFQKWRSTGEEQWMRGQDTGVYNTRDDPLALRVDLYLACDQADAEWEVETVEELNGRLRRSEYWQGHMTILERKHPERWGRREASSGTDRTIEDMLEEWRRARANPTPSQA